MTDLRKAVEMAVPLLIGYREYSGDHRIANRCGEVLEALRQALAQPEQVHDCGEAGHDEGRCGNFYCITKPAPPRKEWVGLTDEDAANICMQSDVNNWRDEQVIDAVEAKLKEKNT